MREIHARLGPEGRVEAAFAASELVREAVVAGIRMRQPDLDDEGVKDEVIRIFYGDELAAKVRAAKAERAASVERRHPEGAR